MKKTMITAAILATTLAATSVSAESQSRHGGKEFEPITRAEMMKRAGERFDKMDRDGDGVLSRKELAGAKKHSGGKDGRGGKGGKSPFAHMDINDDGKVSFAEFKVVANKMAEKRGGDVDQERMKQRFDRMDADGNGYLTAKELARVKAKHAKEGKKDAWKEKKGEWKDGKKDQWGEKKDEWKGKHSDKKAN